MIQPIIALYFLLNPALYFLIIYKFVYKFDIKKLNVKKSLYSSFLMVFEPGIITFFVRAIVASIFGLVISYVFTDFPIWVFFKKFMGDPSDLWMKVFVPKIQFRVVFLGFTCCNILSLIIQFLVPHYVFSARYPKYKDVKKIKRAIFLVLLISEIIFRTVYIIELYMRYPIGV